MQECLKFMFFKFEDLKDAIHLKPLRGESEIRESCIHLQSFLRDSHLPLYL